MAISETFRVEVLDETSRAYLHQVRERRGRGMPGYFVPRQNYLAVVSLIFGFSVIVATFFIAFPPIHEPIAEAMLQTAGLLLGGWCIVAAFRMWNAENSGRYVGHFIYADAEHLWECAGSKVTATNLMGLIRANVTHHSSDEGKYLKSDVTLWLDGGKRTIQLDNSQRAERLGYFLSVLPGLRLQDASYEDRSPQTRSPAVIGGLAAEWAKGNNVPTNAALDQLGLAVAEIPQPTRTGTPSSGLLPCLLIVGLATAGVFLFKTLNVPWRDDAIFDHIQQIHHEPSRAPWLRAYLADARNTRHRTEAQQMLDRIYDDALARIKIPFGQPVADAELQTAFAQLIAAVRGYPQPVVSIGVKGPANDSNVLSEREVQDAIFGQFERTLGEQVIGFVKAPENIPGLIEFSWQYQAPQPPPAPTTIVWTISFRHKPDDMPTTFVRRTTHNPGMAPLRVGAVEIAQKIVGNLNAPPPPAVSEDDF